MPANLLNNTDAIVHIGAGRCRELDDYLASPAQQIILVEPNPRLVAELRRLGEADTRIRVVEAAVSNDSADNLLQEYNLPDVNSLYGPTGLRQLFPGLRLLGQLPVSTLTGQELLDHCALEGEDNILIIEAPGAELPIIETLTEAGGIDKFSRIAINCAEEPLYDSPSYAGAVLKLLQEQGFDLVNRDDTDPDWPNWVLHRNALKQKFTAITMQYQTVSMQLKAERKNSEQLRGQLHELREQLKAEKERRYQAQAERRQADADKQTAEKKIKQEQARVKNLDNQLNRMRTELKASNDKLYKLERDKKFAKSSDQEQIKQLKSLEQQLDDLRTELKASSEQLKLMQSARDQAEARANALDDKLRSLEHQKQSEQQGSKEQDLKNLETRMEYFFEQQRLQMEQAANALGRHITTTASTTARELEAGISLQYQFGGTFPNLEEQGNRLPSTVALKLSQQLKSQPYDVILEMGSGVTTTFMAHTLKNASRNTDGKNSEQTELARYVDPSEDDLPKRIVCFEHNRAKYNELADNLKKSGLAPVVGLEFAPLVPFSHNGKEHLFYDCGSRLRNIAKLLEGRQARIFILVNRVIGDSQPEPLVALPQVLQYLSGHTLDIVVHTQGRTDLPQHWQTLLEHRGLEYQAITEYGDKHIQRVTVNP